LSTNAQSTQPPKGRKFDQSSHPERRANKTVDKSFYINKPFSPNSQKIKIQPRPPNLTYLNLNNVKLHLTQPQIVRSSNFRGLLIFALCSRSTKFFGRRVYMLTSLHVDELFRLTSLQVDELFWSTSLQVDELFRSTSLQVDEFTGQRTFLVDEFTGRRNPVAPFQHTNAA
jgi:hypothetical protein